MKTLNLNDIIKLNNDKTTSINYESLQPYLKSLNVYYKYTFGCDPILMITDVMNACSYAKIVSSNEFNESVCDYIECELHEIQNNDDYLSQFETICYNSKMLKDFINN